MVQTSASLPPGLVVLHSNRQEMLKQVLIEWMRNHPLGILESETLLVQSNGIGQWLKTELARDVSEGGAGIAANIELRLPAMFLWQAYRAVLGEVQVPRVSPYDKTRLRWRLMRLLVDLPADPVYAPLRDFLAQGSAPELRRFQLAERLADLYDQYQIYRADWLNDWAVGNDQIRNALGELTQLEPDQQWQAALWRAIRTDLNAQCATSRADLHQQFIDACRSDLSENHRLPSRVIVFGVSALPAQMLEALSALSEKMQVLLCVLNPCRHFWGDIVEGKELLKREKRRHKLKPDFPDAISDEDLHLHAQPLLAAWGKQGRDYINLLDQIDRSEEHFERFELSAVDLFEPEENSPLPDSLLAQLQWQILELEPPDPDLKYRLELSDDSLRFTGAHSAQREVEILQDQLLDAFANDPTLVPRDVLVMVPDVDQYRAHIDAVFSLISPGDPRHIPYSISDQSAKARVPLLNAVEYLLNLGQNRLLIAELLDLLELPAIQQRFGFQADSIPALAQWVRAAGIRWGLDGEHRTRFGLSKEQTQNSWMQGLSRMLLGYISGEDASFAGIEPLAQVKGLGASAVGALAELLYQLQRWYQISVSPQPIDAWQGTLLAFLEQFFDPQSVEEQLMLQQLRTTLQQMTEQALEAQLNEPLPLELVSKAWLAAVEQPDLSQRFMAGGLTFATLMPMRAIPYRRIYLLGMNDGVYPRSQPPLDMDLMSLTGQYRPGDRSRREDDRYLFLEALLSARDHLNISWIAQSVRDNTEQPPSVLVAQLRDHIDQGWVASGFEKASQALMQQHPLQPFSENYFRPDTGLFTYAHEWREIHDTHQRASIARVKTQEVSEAAPLNINELGRFLKNPLAHHYAEGLGIHLLKPDEIPPEHERFALNRLDDAIFGQRIIDRVSLLPAAEIAAQIDLELTRLKRAGELPWGGFAERDLAQLHSKVFSAVRHLGWTADRDKLVSEPRRFECEIENEHWIGQAINLYEGSAPVLARAIPSALKGKEYPRTDKLLRDWPMHLLVSCTHPGVVTRVSGPDHILQIAPLDADEARALLEQLVSWFRENLRSPLPLVPKTALALIYQGETKAAVAYEGNYTLAGELNEQDQLRAHWPDFASLMEAGLERYAREIYEPLKERVDYWQKPVKEDAH